MRILQSERMNLREMNENDADNLMEIFGDPVAMRYYPSTFPREIAIKWIALNRSYYEKYGCGMWMCELKETGGFVGQCGIVPQTVDGVAEMEIGYLFVPKHWRRGLATEAALAVRDFGFYVLGFERLIATIYHTNAPSVKIAERIGMKFEKRTFVGSSDDLIYGISRPQKAQP